MPAPDAHTPDDASTDAAPISSTRSPRRVLPVPGLVDVDALSADAGTSEATGPVAADLGLPSGDAPASDAPEPASDAVPGKDAGDDGEEAALTSPTESDARVPPVEPANDPRSITGSMPALADATAMAFPERLAPAVADAREATRSRGRELVALVLRYGKAHVPARTPRPVAPDTGPPRYAGRLGAVLPLLQVIPWILGVLFAASFVWDTPTGLVRVLTVSGLIGFGTNWLAITMLFQPREKRAVIPQGLIPAQRERVIYRLSEAISRELINADIIKQRIQESGVIGRYRDLALGVVRGVVEDPGFRSDLKGLATDYAGEVLGSESVRRELARVAVEKVEEQAGQGLGGMALRLYRTFAEDDFQRRVDRALAELPQAIVPLLDRVDVALDAVPARVEAHADEIEDIATRAVLAFVEGLDVRTMIAEKARTFDEAQLESLLKSTSNEQLRYIQYLGAVLGVVGGFVIWRPVEALLLLTALSLGLWGLDEALVRARRRRVRDVGA